MSTKAQDTTQNASENKDIQETKKTQRDELTMFDDMEKMFDRFLKDRWSTPIFGGFPEMTNFRLHSEVREPSVDVIEKESDIIVRAEIPGVEKKDIDITLNANNLTLQGKSRHETREDTDEYHRCEIATGAFSRTIALPSDVDGNNVKATFTDGLLEITLPKAENRNQIKVSVD